LVTGASRGIGRGIALALAGEGYAVAINYNQNRAAAEQTKQQIESIGGGAAIIQADISLTADRQALVEHTLEAFGHIDLLVNNAGVAPTVRADILEASEQSFDRLIDVDLKGPYFLTQLVARQMITQLTAGNGQMASKPKIVIVSSMSAYTASVNRGDYCIAKAGLSMVTKLFAARLAEYGINVYEIRPGVIATDMTGPVQAKYDKLIFEEDLTPIHRWGQPEDIGKAVVAIAKGLLPFSTGEVLNVDGGFHLHRL
jgi:NAD(P)-dependent dehydrogenase (short-subunit alcohol dehydrogenase family)